MFVRKLGLAIEPPLSETEHLALPVCRRVKERRNCRELLDFAMGPPSAFGDSAGLSAGSCVAVVFLTRQAP